MSGGAARRKPPECSGASRAPPLHLMHLIQANALMRTPASRVMRMNTSCGWGGEGHQLNEWAWLRVLQASAAAPTGAAAAAGCDAIRRGAVHAPPAATHRSHLQRGVADAPVHQVHLAAAQRVQTKQTKQAWVSAQRSGGRRHPRAPPATYRSQAWLGRAARHSGKPPLPGRHPPHLALTASMRAKMASMAASPTGSSYLRGEGRREGQQ